MKTSMKVKLKSAVILSFSFMTVLFYQNCSKPVSQSSSLVSGLTAFDIVEQKAVSILTTKCSSCHNVDSPNGGVDVLSVDKLLASGAVVPTEPAISPLFQAISNGSMPPGKPLNQEDIMAISDWITKMTKDVAVVLPPDVAIPLGPTFASINKNILVPKCVRCHNAANSGGGVSYATYATSSNTVQRNLPMNSSLYTSVAVRNTMPKNAPGSLSTEERMAIFNWITAGGLNN